MFKVKIMFLLVIIIISAGYKKTKFDKKSEEIAKTQENNTGIEKNVTYFEEQLALAENDDVKAMTYLGHAYYYGIDTEQNYEKSFYWSLKAAGFLDSDAMLHIAYLYKEGKGCDKNIEKAYYWYELAAANKSEKREAYRVLQKLYDSEDSYMQRKLKKEIFSANNIPESLIKKAQKYYVSYDTAGFINQYSIPFFNDFNLLNLSDKMQEYVGGYQKTRQFDSCYKADLDGDGKDELFFYTIEGSSGVSDILIVSQNVSGVYDFQGEIYEQTETVTHGIYGLIRFEDQYYFTISYFELGDGSICGMEIFSFEDNELSESVYITREQDGFDFIQTFQKDRYLDGMVDELEAEIVTVMANSGYNAKVYFGDESKQYNQSGVNCVNDLDNDGTEEYFRKVMWLTSSISIPNRLDIVFLKKEGIDFVEDNSVNYLSSRYLLGTLLQFFIKEYQGVNYLAVLTQKEGTNLYNLTVFEWSDGEAVLQANFLIFKTWKQVEMK